MFRWFTSDDKIKPGFTFYPLRHPVYFGTIFRKGAKITEFKYNKITGMWLKTSRIVDLNKEIS